VVARHLKSILAMSLAMFSFEVNAVIAYDESIFFSDFQYLIYMLDEI
jgi:hypothetical protein